MNLVLLSKKAWKVFFIIELTCGITFYKISGMIRQRSFLNNERSLVYE